VEVASKLLTFESIEDMMEKRNEMKQHAQGHERHDHKTYSKHGRSAQDQEKEKKRKERTQQGDLVLLKKKAKINHHLRMNAYTKATNGQIVLTILTQRILMLKRKRITKRNPIVDDHR